MERALHAILCAATVALIACASSYALSPAALAERAHLSPESARAIVAEAVKQESDDPSGLRRASLGRSGSFGEWVHDVTVSQRGIEFMAPGGDTDPDDDAPEPGCVSTRNNLVPVDGKAQPTTCHYVFDLAKIQSIRVIAVEPDDTPAGAGRSGYDVVLRQSFLYYVTVNVGKSELDRFMAALTFFSPRAALSEVGL